MYCNLKMANERFGRKIIVESILSSALGTAWHASLVLRVQAELQKGVEEGLARVAELEQRIAAVSIEGGDVEGEDPVSFVVI